MNPPWAPPSSAYVPLVAEALAGASTEPDPGGHFGPFGGRFMPEALMAALAQVDEAYRSARRDPAFYEQFAALLTGFAGRPSPLVEAPRFAAGCGARVLLKREDLNHTGSHKINNVLGQALLTRRMGKNRIIAETGAGQHGVAAATAAALFGLECVVYMGAEDMRRQALNVARMRILGAEVVPVTVGSQTLKDALNEALRDWVTNVEQTHYLLGTAAGPHPFPTLVRDLQRVIGLEIREQVRAFAQRPTAVVACVGGGSNAIGAFSAFVDDPEVRLVGFEAGGTGIASGRHASSISGGSVGVLHGARTYLLQDEYGQTRDSHSISAGLDYPAVGPEHAWLHHVGRVSYEPVDDDEALAAFTRLSRTEGIIPAIESAHALAGALRLAPSLAAPAAGEPIVVVCLSGRGDKDMQTAVERLGLSAREPLSEGASA